MENNKKKPSSSVDNSNVLFDSQDSRLYHHHHQESRCFNLDIFGSSSSSRNNYTFIQESNFLATFKGQNPEEQKKSALSDNDHKEYLLTKTSDETTRTSTKKRQSNSVDLDLPIIRRFFPTTKVGRGCDRCSFKLLGSDISVTDCKHMNNNKSMMIVDSHKNQDSETEKKKTTKKRQKKEDYNVIAPTQLPQSIIENINRNGGRELRYIGTKNLTKTDVAKHHNRLNFINSDALLNALTPEERVKVTGEQSKGLEVKMMHVSSGREYKMNIRKRTYHAAAVINRQWSKLVSENGLSEHDLVQFWGYRISNGEFSLVLNVVTRRDNNGGNNNNGEGGSSNGGNGEEKEGSRGMIPNVDPSPSIFYYFL